MNHGKLVPEDVIFGLLSKRLEEGYCRGETGFILDGIPRTKMQAVSHFVFLVYTGLLLIVLCWSVFISINSMQCYLVESKSFICFVSDAFIYYLCY